MKMIIDDCINTYNLNPYPDESEFYLCHHCGERMREEKFGEDLYLCAECIEKIKNNIAAENARKYLDECIEDDEWEFYKEFLKPIIFTNFGEITKKDIDKSMIEFAKERFDDYLDAWKRWNGI